MFPCPACRHLHFWKLNNICHFSGHLINLSMSSCSCCLSPFPLIFLKSLVSSANFNILLVTPSSRSLMYIKNKIGPSTDPCGTPLKTGFQFETSPSTTTLCLLSVSHCSIQFIILIPIPWDFNLVTNGDKCPKKVEDQQMYNILYICVCYIHNVGQFIFVSVWCATVTHRSSWCSRALESVTMFHFKLEQHGKEGGFPSCT